jgi:D-alanyl-D-alanine carboxypeptidase-like protein
MRAAPLALVVFLLAASAAFGASPSPIAPLTRAQGRAILEAKEWHSGCPVSFSQLRVLTVRYHGFDRRAHWGRLVVNARVAGKLQAVFAKLYELRFPIHHMQFGDAYGSLQGVPKDGDFTASFECRQASASPCTGATTNKTTGSWSMHAYGEAIDLNPVENPYVGCGMTRDKTALSYLKRSNVRRGMVTPAVIAAFASIGWGWGGSWFGSTKDYMHFSANGH